MSDENILPVLLSGGAGSRLWPVSRESYPKQLWPLVSDHSLIQQTALRAAGPRFLPPMVLCNHEHRFLIAEQLRAVGIAGARIVLEPVGRNSAPAIAAACLLAAEDDSDRVLWTMASDAAIADTAALREALALAIPAARAGHIVTFGVAPTRPETGFGYIRRGAALAAAPGAYDVAAFVEKPDAARAAAYLQSGEYFWNSGMFAFTARAMLRELERHAPDVLELAAQAVTNRRADLDFIRLNEAAFAACPSISIDYAVAEKCRHAAMVPATFDWSDIGSWDALWQLGEKDAGGNVLVGDVLADGAENCYIRSEGRLAAVAGLTDIVLVATEDVTLAVHRSRAQDVKALVEQLRRRGRPEATTHRRCHRPWGHYESLTAEARFQVKRLVVLPGRQLSLQSHFHRAEHWVVVSGTAQVTRDHEELILRENESVYLPLGCVHRLRNPGRIPLTIIEVQSGSYLGEDDIVRLDDVYGRAAAPQHLAQEAAG